MVVRLDKPPSSRNSYCFKLDPGVSTPFQKHLTVSTSLASPPLSSSRNCWKCNRLYQWLFNVDDFAIAKVPLVFSQDVENILPRLCRVCNLMDTKHSYTACDLLLQLTRPHHSRVWTCIKQEPGTENIDMYPEKRSLNANQKSLVCYLTVMVLFQQLCRFGLCDVLFAQKSTPNSSCKCDTLAFVLSQLNLWHPPKNGGNILPRLCRVWNLMDAKLSYTACDLLLQLTRPHHSSIGLASNKSLALKTSTCILEKRSPNADQKSLVCYLSVMVLFQQLCRFRLCMSCLLRRALQTHHVNVTHWLLSCLNLTFGILPRMGETSCQGFGRVWNLMAAKHFLYCLWPAAEAYNRYWTCIKQEPGTENIDMYPKKRSPNANQKSLVCYLPLMVLFKQVCRFRLCDVLLAQKSTPNSLCKCDTLAFVLSQLNLWHPPKNAGNILPRLCRVWNLMDAKLSYTACDLLLQLTRPHHSSIGLASNKSLALKTSTCILKSGLQMRTKKA